MKKAANFAKQEANRQNENVASRTTGKAIIEGGSSESLRNINSVGALHFGTYLNTTNRIRHRPAAIM